MIDTIYAIKKLNTQSWDKAGKRLPITVLELPQLKVTQVKTSDKDGYEALQVGFGTQKVSRITKPLKGHLKVDGANETVRYLKEVMITATDTDNKPSVGDSVNITDVIQVGDVVNVTARSKGTGFTGVVKRWNFGGGPKTHGQSDRHRAPGSIGQGTTPGRVYKGKRMAGRDGFLNVTQKNLMIVKIDLEANEIWLKGTTPGHKGTLVTIKKTSHKDFIGLHTKVAEETTQENNQVSAEDTAAKE